MTVLGSDRIEARVAGAVLGNYFYFGEMMDGRAVCEIMCVRWNTPFPAIYLGLIRMGWR